MSKKVNHAAPKSAKINPDAPQAEAIPSPAPKAIPSQTSEAKPADDYRTELVKKAQAAKNAAAVGLIPQEQADALWVQAVEACKPSPEAIALAKAAKAKKDDAEKVLKAAYKRKVQEFKVQSGENKTLCVLRFDLCAEYAYRDHELGIASGHQKG